ncbi:MAG: electron transfer flavoprotein subunit alpha/FixB family protein [Syntrophomonadaceae bacterium]|nr:electron transfer flavoprotein subunit alpha/FixB family protein [Syntrophomonadaceae bacterium]
MPGIWVVADNQEQIFELLAAGRDLAQKMGERLTALLWGDRGLVQEVIDRGADEVLLLPPPGREQPVESGVATIADLARTEEPEAMLFGGTLRVKEIAARVASRLDVGLCSDCIAFNFDQQQRRLEMERLVYGGAAIQTVAALSRPGMATLPPRSFEPAQRLEGRSGTVRELPPPPAGAVKVVERRPRQREAGDIATARVVVCAGRGIEKREDLALVRELAEVLGGEVGCTRPIAEELNWLPEETYIGLSGKKVRPALYIGIGISGQIQHTTGIRDSKVIVAINRDENAPIFEQADYGLVGDLYEVLPRLIQEFRRELNKQEQRL